MTARSSFAEWKERFSAKTTIQHSDRATHLALKATADLASYSESEFANAGSASSQNSFDPVGGVEGLEAAAVTTVVKAMAALGEEHFFWKYYDPLDALRTSPKKSPPHTMLQYAAGCMTSLIKQRIVRLTNARARLAAERQEAAVIAALPLAPDRTAYDAVKENELDAADELDTAEMKMKKAKRRASEPQASAAAQADYIEARSKLQAAQREVEERRAEIVRMVRSILKLYKINLIQPRAPQQVHYPLMLRTVMSDRYRASPSSLHCTATSWAARKILNSAKCWSRDGACECTSSSSGRNGSRLATRGINFCCLSSRGNRAQSRCTSYRRRRTAGPSFVRQSY